MQGFFPFFFALIFCQLDHFISAQTTGVLQALKGNQDRRKQTVKDMSFTSISSGENARAQK